MEAQKVLEKIRQEKIIAIIRGVASEYIIDTAKAIKQGGVSNMEITFNHSTKSGLRETLESIQKVKQYFKNDVNVGAGTILTIREVELAAEAGADYMISPNTDVNVIRRTKELGKISIPGAFTPSEACSAYESGGDIVKMFPAGILGLEYLKAIRAPLNHIPMCAVGGISPENMKEFMEIGIDCFGIGGKLVSLEAIQNKDFQKLTDAALRYTNVLR